jgi:uncharacterized protein YutE (UPF0331/DUF86 family)
VKVEPAEGVTTFHLECGHTSRRFYRTLVDGVTISDSVEISLIIDPRRDVEESLRNKDYFKAATLLSAVLEYYGKLAIDKRLESEKHGVDWEKIERLHLPEVSLLLYGLGIITQACYARLMQLVKLRNSLLHVKDAAEFRRSSGPEAEATVRNALECIDMLQTK